MIGRALLRAAIPLLLVLGGLAVPPGADATDPAHPGVVRLDAARLGTATRSPRPLRVAAERRRQDPGQKVQRVTVAWKGTGRKRVQSRSAVVPGIGRLTLTCRPDATFVRLKAEDRTAETQLWMAKYETKGGHAVVATKTARIYRYSHAGDDGRGGTGASASEGLNQLGDIENFSSGYLDGIISQRPGRHLPVTGSTAPPVTSLRLNWWWTGFRRPPSWRACRIDAVVTTGLSPRMGVSWHGDADAVTSQYAEYALPGLGTLQLRCEPDSGGFEGRHTVALAPVERNRRARIWAETVTGEGRTENHVEAEGYDYDPVSGLVGSIDLPRNGMMRLFVEVGDAKRTYILSSYLVTNDAARPELNVCETAVAVY